jgi:hypothetical protein
MALLRNSEHGRRYPLFEPDIGQAAGDVTSLPAALLL